MDNKKVNIPGNFSYGDMPADYRMRYKQMLETQKTKKDTKKGSKKSKGTESAIDRITRILYGGSNK